MTGDRQFLTARQLQSADGLDDWRVLGSGAAAWFPTASHAQGAQFAARVLGLGQGRVVLDADVRARGVRVRLPMTPVDEGWSAPHLEAARAVSAVAAELGLVADPTPLQDVQLALDVLDQAAVQPFWGQVLGYAAVGGEDLMDPLRRRSPIWFQQQDAPRPLRNRLHLDAVTAVDQGRGSLAAAPALGAASVAHHGFYATVADAEGNEVDLVPLQEGADRWPDPGTEDWRLVFAAMACHRADSAQLAGDFAERVAALADQAGLGLGIDLRAHGDGAFLVVLDSGKDRWEIDEGYQQLAARVQIEARALGLPAEPGLASFLQVVIDAVDIAAVRRFWQVALAYEQDPRPEVTDLVDPRGLSMPFVFQDLDADDSARRQQRNRLHVDLFLPDDRVAARLEAVVAAGGRVVRDGSPIWWTVADPEGNELDLTTAVGREEAGQVPG